MFKKILAIGTIVFSFFFVMSGTVHASSKEVVPSDYYFVRPALNKELYVQPYKFTLMDGFNDFQRFEFFYIPEKEAYIINDQFGGDSVSWTGVSGTGNLIMNRQDSNDLAMLWTMDEVAKDQYIIRNKKDSSMVWNVNNANAIVGEHVNLEKLYPVTSPYRNAQVFVLDTGR